MSLQNSGNLETNFKFFWAKSKRTLPEQLIGFFLFLTTIITVMLINAWITKHAHWEKPLILERFLNPALTGIYTLISLSFWTLWRKFSFKLLKMECAFLGASLVLNVAWHIMFLYFNEPFLGLIINLMMFATSILSFYIFWRKDRIAAIIFLPYVIFSGILTSFNMFYCT
ncbi:MAG: hypothetical protein COT84_07390 [Chlamydiae bacterium CG10_big_fil_rev_8_21_14_0_10_35_9]|nr:MAG: hypothetical protein COT84_07390 [Chlamydiae bacterium CG10_big_fil_rev_8_21_14_0_10_35_9]